MGIIMSQVWRLCVAYCMRYEASKQGAVFLGHPISPKLVLFCSYRLSLSFTLGDIHVLLL
jgi:hypothetical protein